MIKATVRHARTGIILAESAILANSFGLRGRGLIGRKFGGFDGMIFPKCGSIHTCFMGMEIDVLFLDADGVVVGMRDWMGAWGAAGAKGAKTVVELPAGSIEGIAVGDQIAIQSAAEVLRPKVRDGDLVFIATPNTLYRRVASASGTWTSHVGFVYQKTDDECLVVESTVPVSRITTFDKFVARSDYAQFAVLRLGSGVDEAGAEALRASAMSRLKVPYNLWFDYESDWQFCSKLVYQCFDEALGVKLGELTTFRDVMEARPEMPLAFWRMWFLGRIPWAKRTVTPADQLFSPHLETVHHDEGIRFVPPEAQDASG